MREQLLKLEARQHGDLLSPPVTALKGKGRCCVCSADSPCCTPETNTALSIDETSVKKLNKIRDSIFLQGKGGSAHRQESNAVSPGAAVGRQASCRSGEMGLPQTQGSFPGAEATVPTAVPWLGSWGSKNQGIKGYLAPAHAVSYNLALPLTRHRDIAASRNPRSW